MGRGWGGKEPAAATCPDRQMRVCVCASPGSSQVLTSGSPSKGCSSGAHASSARIPAERVFFIHSDVSGIRPHVLREYNPVPVNDDDGVCVCVWGGDYQTPELAPSLPCCLSPSHYILFDF